MWCGYSGVSVFRSVKEVFEKCTKGSLRQRGHRAYRIHKYILVRFLAKEVKYWSDFGQIFKQNWSDSQSDFGEY